MDTSSLKKILLVVLFILSARCLFAQGINVNPLNADSLAKTIPAKQGKAIGGAIFLGRGLYRGNVSKYFNDPYFIGISIDVHRRHWVFEIDDYVGLTKVKQDLVFTPDAQWAKGSSAFVGTLSGNLGYSVIESRNFKVVPLAGIGFTFMSSKLLGTSKISDYEPLLGTYKVGAYVDLKAIKLIQPEYNDDDYYTCLRVSLGLTNTIGTPKYDNFYSGPMAYITLGLGGLSR